MKGIFFLLAASASYFDGELSELWDSISDITQPSLQDYQAIERYLKEGERPYLDPFKLSICCVPEELRVTYCRRLNLLYELQLLGPNGEMPVFEVHKVNVTQETEDRCILLFASYNQIYPDKVRALCRKLKESGYRGHILLRIGGFPNTRGGG